MSTTKDNSLFIRIINLYKEGVKKLPVLKYSWGVIVIICILALITYLNIGNPETLIKGSLYIIGVMFLIFLFSLMANTKDKAIKYPLYILIYSIILLITAFVIGFGIHSLTNYKFEVYYKLFGYPSKPEQSQVGPNNQNDTSNNDNHIDTSTHKNIFIGRGKDVEVPFGGSPYCNYTGIISNSKIVLTKEINSTSVLSYTYSHFTESSCYTADNRKVSFNYISKDVIINGDNIDILFDSKDEVHISASFNGMFFGNKIRGNLTIKHLNPEFDESFRPIWTIPIVLDLQ